MTGRNDVAERIRRRKLEPLADPLDAVKRRDAAALGEIQARIQAYDDKIAALRAELYTARAAFDPMDVKAAAALDGWTVSARRRIAVWEAEREALRPEWETARDALLRSNGEVEAIKRLTR